MNTDNTKAKAIQLLKEYVRQMRATGYSDALIKRKLMQQGSITIPNQLPQGLGQGAEWTGGLQEELRGAIAPKSMELAAANRMVGGQRSIEASPLFTKMPGADEYSLYQQGATVNRLPSFSEMITQPTGQFGQTKQQNLIQALNDYLANYKGKTVPWSEFAAEKGLVGMPQDLAQDWMGQMQTIEEQKAQESKNFLMNLVNKGAAPEEFIAVAYATEEPITVEQATAFAKIGGWIDPVEAQKIESGVNKKLQDFGNTTGVPNYGAVLIDRIQKGESINSIKVQVISDGLMLDDDEWNWLFNKYTFKGIAKVGSSFGGNIAQPSLGIKNSYSNYPQPTRGYRNQVEQQLANLKSAGAKF